MGSSLEFLLEIKCDIAKLLLDVPDNFTFGAGVEGITTLHQALDQMVGKVTTGKVQTENRMGECETFVDGDSVGNTITRVQDDTGRATRGVEGQDGLDGNVEGRCVKGLEHNLGHLFTVSLGVEGCLSEQDGVLFRSNTEFIVEGVMPNLFHVIPVCDDTVLDGVLEGEDTTLGLSLVTERGSEGA